MRTRFRLLADGIIVYTASEAREAMRETPQLPTFVAPNALMRATAMVPRRTLNRPWRFLYVGRLAPEKKPELLLNAFLEARSDLAADTRLTFVGDGPSAAQLQRQARESGLSDRIDFCGHLSDLGDLKAQYSQTLASVSPGYAGLSLTQSLGFGVPMLIADREPHAPEIEAAVPEFNCRYFTADSPSALALALTQLEHEAGLWISRAAAISQACRDTYSIDRTAASLAEALTSF